MSSKLIYFRMFGYVVTIIMHAVNTVSMTLVLQEEECVELFKNPTVKFFNDNQARYFTCWTFFLQWVYAFIGLTCDLLTLKNSDKEDYKLNIHLRRARDTLFAAVLWPATFMVSSLFWTLFHVDRELIFPPILDKALTRTSNHVIHTAIVPVVLWEAVFRPRKQPKSHFWNLAHSLFHFVVYYTVVFYTYYESGAWIYPIFKKSWGTILFPTFMIITWILMVLYYYIQWPLNRFIHGDVTNAKEKVR